MRAFSDLDFRRIQYGEISHSDRGKFNSKHGIGHSELDSETHMIKEKRGQYEMLVYPVGLDNALSIQDSALEQECVMLNQVQHYALSLPYDVQTFHP